MDLTLLTSMEAELEAKPSMEGAVPTMPLLRPVAWANTLLKSLSTPRADAEDEVAGGVEVHHHRAKFPLRGGDAVVPAWDDVGLEGHARPFQHLFHARARGAVGVVVADHEGGDGRPRH